MVIPGNFLIRPGAHWDELRRRLRLFAVGDVLTTFPPLASSIVRAEATDASRRIRAERCRYYDLPVVMQNKDGAKSIRINPIPNSDPLRVPFEYRRDNEYLFGALRLKAPNDPLALAVVDRSADPRVIVEAWLFALLSYRDLTCRAEPEPVDLVVDLDLDDSEHPQNRKRSGPSPGGASASPARRSLRDEHPTVDLDVLNLPQSLKPTEATRRALATFVAGYRRRLPAGHTHSPQAARTAEQLGITLAKHETWVPPHWRSRDRPDQLEFDWSFPFRLGSRGDLT